MAKNRIPRIVLTGGPGGGKSTVLTFLMRKLGDLGYQVFTVPEAARLLRSSGFGPEGVGLEGAEFQSGIMQMMLQSEDLFQVMADKAARRGKRPIIICDRGGMDGLAYCGKKVFNRIAADLGVSMGHFLNERYDGVIHLRSAADGAEEAYAFSDPGRPETPAQAREKDELICQAWTGHDCLRVIPAQADFEVKCREVLASACSILGIPKPIEIQRKFYVSPALAQTLPYGSRKVFIEQHYLANPAGNVHSQIRRRLVDGASIYCHTIKTKTKNGVRYKTERQITKSDFRRLFAIRDPQAKPIIKHRFCFVWENQYFQLDRFHDQLEGLALLEIKPTDRNRELSLHPLYQDAVEVTHDQRFSNWSLARRGKLPKLRSTTVST